MAARNLVKFFLDETALTVAVIVWHSMPARRICLAVDSIFVPSKSVPAKEKLKMRSQLQILSSPPLSFVEAGY